MLLIGHFALPSFSIFTRNAAVTAKLAKNSDSAPMIFDDMLVLAAFKRHTYETKHSLRIF
jgi:hypothetical protein